MCLLDACRTARFELHDLGRVRRRGTRDHPDQMQVRVHLLSFLCWMEVGGRPWRRGVETDDVAQPRAQKGYVPYEVARAGFELAVSSS